MDDSFLWWFGAFHSSWASAENLTCYAIKKLLNITTEQAHILTAGMEFGRKVTLLRNLVYHSEIENKPAIMRALNKLRDQSKRNVFAHGLLVSNEDAVTFIDRSKGGDYSATKHVFTLENFASHVRSVVASGAELETALGASKSELHEFAMAAVITRTKSSKSPEPPSSSE